MLDAELGITITALAAIFAGLVRGFAGFGGPAILIAILTIFYPPAMVVSKVLVVDFFASLLLFFQVYRQTNWRITLALAVPGLLIMPLGHWLLVIMDADMLASAISLTILGTCLAMLSGWRYRRKPGLFAIVLMGLVSGIVFGASYIALVGVAAILLSPWDHREARNLIISWAFLMQLGFTVVTATGGTLGLADIAIALPGAVLYLVATWVGSRLFRGAGEARYRKVALFILIVLAVLGLVY